MAEAAKEEAKPRRRRSTTVSTEIPGVNMVATDHDKNASKPLCNSLYRLANSKLDETSNTLGLTLTMAATRPGVGIFKACLFNLALIIVIVLQLCLMSTFCLASALPPCSTTWEKFSDGTSKPNHKACKSGQFCCHKCEVRVGPLPQHNCAC